MLVVMFWFGWFWYYFWKGKDTIITTFGKVSMYWGYWDMVGKGQEQKQESFWISQVEKENSLNEGGFDGGVKNSIRMQEIQIVGFSKYIWGRSDGQRR